MAMRYAAITESDWSEDPPLRNRLRLIVIVVATVVVSAFPRAERMGYPPQEFAARRQQLAKALQSGTGSVCTG